jgi:hypothetical protein
MPPQKFNLNFRGTFDIKRAFEIVLREIFASDIVEEKFRYVPPPDIPQGKAEELEKQGIDYGGGERTKIRIYRSFPKRLISYPAIVISTSGFDASLTAMGESNEEVWSGQDQGTVTSHTAGGYLIVPVEIKIHSKESPNDRDRLTDIMLILLRILRRNYFSRFGLGYRTIRVSGEDQYEDPRGDGIVIFTNTLTVECQTDFTYQAGQDVNELFETLVLKVFMQAQEGGELVLFAQP